MPLHSGPSGPERPIPRWVQRDAAALAVAVADQLLRLDRRGEGARRRSTRAEALQLAGLLTEPDGHLVENRLQYWLDNRWRVLCRVPVAVFDEVQRRLERQAEAVNAETARRAEAANLLADVEHDDDTRRWDLSLSADDQKHIEARRDSKPESESASEGGSVGSDEDALDDIAGLLDLELGASGSSGSSTDSDLAPRSGVSEHGDGGSGDPGSSGV